MELLQSVFGFVIAIGVLVAFHEFGHYWVARRLGVKVLRYSIGFGKPLLSWRRGADDIEYVIAAIPLGGYVKMLDEREGDVPEAERHRAFNRQSLPVRSAIVVAGPVFNFIFALFAYWAIFVGGSTEMRPVVGEVLPESPAAVAGFQHGDELLAIDGERVRSWDQVLMALLQAGVDRRAVPVQVRGEAGAERLRELDLSGVRALGEEQDYLKVVGLRPWVPRIDPIIGTVLPGSPAEAAGLVPGDRVLAFDDTSIADWQALVEYVAARPGERVEMTLQSGGQQRRVETLLASRDQNGRAVGTLGVGPDVPEDLYQGMLHEVRYGPLEALSQAATATWDASVLTLKVLWQMLIGEASLKNLSGPLSIGQYAGTSVDLGLMPFLKFLAIVSISLGVLNLLPVPVLDGGHLLYYGIEAVRRRPLSEAAQVRGQQIGIALLLMLMTVAFYNDISRLLL